MYCFRFNSRNQFRTLAAAEGLLTEDDELITNSPSDSPVVGLWSKRGTSVAAVCNTPALSVYVPLLARVNVTSDAPVTASVRLLLSAKRRSSDGTARARRHRSSRTNGGVSAVRRLASARVTDLPPAGSCAHSPCWH